MSWPILHSHPVEMSWRILHIFNLFLDLPIPTLSLLRDLQVSKSHSYPASSISAGSNSSLLFSLKRESFHLSLRTSSGCFFFRGFVVLRKLFLDLSLKLGMFCLCNGYISFCFGPFPVCCECSKKFRRMN